MKHPLKYGLPAAVTPGTPGGLLRMLAEYGTMSLAEVLAPAIEMAQGYPIEAQAANAIEENREEIEVCSPKNTLKPGSRKLTGRLMILM